jgi:hypothetical protein
MEQTRLGKNFQMPRHPRLPHLQQGYQLVHGKFVLVQHQSETQPRFVRQGLQQAQCVRHNDIILILQLYQFSLIIYINETGYSQARGRPRQAFDRAWEKGYKPSMRTKRLREYFLLLLAGAMLLVWMQPVRASALCSGGASWCGRAAMHAAAPLQSRADGEMSVSVRHRPAHRHSGMPAVPDMPEKPDAAESCPLAQCLFFSSPAVLPSETAAVLPASVSRFVPIHDNPLVPSPVSLIFRPPRARFQG